MVDVTQIAGAVAGDEAVLLGAQGDDAVTADQLADWLGTIAYEVLTLPGRFLATRGDVSMNRERSR